MTQKPSDERRDPGDLARRAEEQRRSDRGRGEPETVPTEPRESAPHGTVREEPQKPAGPTVSYPSR
jgi:hypothetical protein